MKFKYVLATAALVGCLGAAASAATVTMNFGNQPGNYTPYQESGYNVSGNANGSGSVQLDNSNGNCPFSDPSCLHVSGSNPGTAFIARQGGGVFDGVSLAVKFNGNGNTNFVDFGNGVNAISLALGAIYSGGVYTSSAMTTLVTTALVKKQGYFIDLAAFAVASGQGSGFFNGISLLSFDSSGDAANVRFDDVTLRTPSPVPLPAGGLLLLAGLGSLSALRRKRKAA